MTCSRLQHLAMRVIAILLILTAVAVTDVISFHHHRCPKWKMDCEKYEQHNCNVSKVWTSCCTPLESTGGSGYSNELEKYPSEVYTIKIGAFTKSQVWCDMDADGGGWLTIMRRTKDNEEVSFQRFEEDYMSGFGDLRGDFWLGLRTMNLLTKNGDCELRVDMYKHPNDTDSSPAHVHYTLFKVGNFPNYKLHLGEFSSSDDSLIDSLKQFDSQDFRVQKNETDGTAEVSCAVTNRGGWWYKDRICVNLGTVLTSRDSLEWWFKDAGQPMKKIFYRYEMKIRSKSCSALASSETL